MAKNANAEDLQVASPSDEEIFLKKYQKMPRFESSNSIKNLLHFIDIVSVSDPLVSGGASPARWNFSKSQKVAQKKDKVPQKASSLPAWAYSLNHAIRSPVGVAKLAEYCDSRMNTENLTFIIDLEKFKFSSSLRLQESFNELVGAYIQEDSVQSINITRDVRKQIINIFRGEDKSKITRNIFEYAEKEILRLLDDDIFLNFKNTLEDEEECKPKTFLNSIKCYLSSHGDRHGEDKTPKSSRSNSPSNSLKDASGNSDSLPDEMLNLLQKLE